jgi:predicted HTH transcriptional regulator
MTDALDNLLERLRLGEDTDFELKAGQGKDGAGAVPRSLWETYSAMANTDGGVIVLGVEDKTGRILGLSNPAKVLKALWDGLNDTDTISVNLCQTSDIEAIQTGAGSIIRMRVPRASRKQRPVYIRNPIGGTFRRGHEGDYRVKEGEVKRMLAEALEESRDAALLEGFGLDDLEPAGLQAYRNLFRSTKPGHPWLALEDRALLAMLGGWGQDRATGKEGPTLAGILMFGRFRALHDALPHYLVDYQELPPAGDPTRWLDRVTTDGTWPGNLFDFYRSVYPRLVKDLKVPFRIEGGHHRVDETPVHEAVREALVNALIHGDYSISVGILVQKRPDGFNFRNPGNLRVPLDQALDGGLSDCRNRGLQKMFQMIGEGEQAGSGLPRILAAWKGQHWRAPDLEEHADPEYTTLFLSLASLMSADTLEALDACIGPAFRSLSEEARLVLATALLEGEVTHDRLKTATGLHPADLTELLRSLAKQGFLVATGRGRGTHYHLAEASPSWADSQHSGPNSQHSGPDSQHNGPDSQHKISGEIPNAEWEKLMATAARFREKERAPSAVKVREIILTLASSQFLSQAQLATLLDRSVGTLRNHYLRVMIKAGDLELRFPDPNHPRQAYRTKRAR